MARNSKVSRRTMMKVTGATAATALVAGCSGGDENGDNGGNGDNGDNGDNGNGENGNGDSEPTVESGGEIEFVTGDSNVWIGSAPDSIAEEESPTIVLEEGETYNIGWTEGNGSPHNIAIYNGDEEVVGDYETEQTSEPGDDQWLEIEASSEMAEYVCVPHVSTGMRGNIEII